MQVRTRALFDSAAVSRVDWPIRFDYLQKLPHIWPHYSIKFSCFSIFCHIEQRSLVLDCIVKILDLADRRTMGRLTCSCLNVSVHYKGGSWDSRPVAARRLFPEGSTDRLSGETVCEVELDVAGVTMVSQLSVCETAAAMSGYVAWRGVE